MAQPASHLGLSWGCGCVCGGGWVGGARGWWGEVSSAPVRPGVWCLCVQWIRAVAAIPSGVTPSQWSAVSGWLTRPLSTISFCRLVDVVTRSRMACHDPVTSHSQAPATHPPTHRGYRTPTHLHQVCAGVEDPEGGQWGQRALPRDGAWAPRIGAGAGSPLIHLQLQAGAGMAGLVHHVLQPRGA